MAGYQPHILVTPPAGAGPIDFALDSFETLVTQKWFPEPQFKTKETVRRRLRNIFYGWRLHAIFDWDIVPGSLSEASPDDQNPTSGITYLTRLLLRRDTTFSLSMNGGSTYRDCILLDFSRKYVQDKHVLGRWHMEFACVDLLSEDSLPPEFAQGPPGLMNWRGGT